MRLVLVIRTVDLIYYPSSGVLDLGKPDSLFKLLPSIAEPWRLRIEIWLVINVQCFSFTVFSCISMGGNDKEWIDLT
ncbi:TFIIS N-terminal domain-containing protein [Psidium guajava]|nr:TFIIS N-terminal domain-containing protein [Psidium guajava]